ncbi:GntR family transcriptional regulator [Microvirga pudoricolor]|uniref:GntR family transcriptional regulator n=1 Tax=Microvirga pudoricolor TaxID=2778729 RepID=UPI00194DDB95|nr:GntR family transcriptional regulator [Microvirga pudoricolor]MBM6594023.1 GntR family transcriptional regulator [Microvirga pudoricolor]
MAPAAEALSSRSPERSAQVAYAKIKQRILDNDYAPGIAVLEQALADDLGLSRTPIREALVRLEQEGLVQVVPRHGMKVLPLSPKDMREIYEIMISLELTATDLLARRRPSETEIAPLMQACDDMEEALSRDDLKAWARADERFHFSLVELCGNKRLATMVMGIWEQSHRARMFTLRLRPKPVDSTREHRDVVNAILKGDATLARQLYRNHREKASDGMIAIIEQFGLTRL